MSIRVRDLMTRKPKTVQPTTSLGRASAEMGSSAIRHLPVVSRAGELLGVLSDRDIGTAIGRGPVGRSLPVSSVMAKVVQTVLDTTPAWEAARLLRVKKFGALPVLDAKGALVGIITASDFLAASERALRALDRAVATR
jgi:acetoin utilization protein AcuB